MRQPVLRGFVVSALAAALVGCTGSEPKRELPDVGRTTKISSIDQVVLPMGKYFQTSQELLRQDEAKTIVMSACTQRFGETYVPSEIGLPTPAMSPYRYGLVDRETAAQYGYHDPADHLSVAFSRAHPVVMPTGKPTSKIIIDGPTEAASSVPTDRSGKPVPKGGCKRIVDETLIPPPDVQADVFEALEQFESETKGDPRVRKAISEWSTCMKSRGYSYDSPLRPAIEFGVASDVSTKEVATAVADAECRAATNYVGTRVAISSAYQQRIIDENPEIWEQYGAWIETRNIEVDKVLAANGTQD